MRPCWFTLEGENALPIERMWPDVALWMPILLSGKRFMGRVDYARIEADVKSEEDMVKWWFGTIPD